MFQNSLTYEALRACQLKAMRNGNWRLLDGLERGFYRACMVYVRFREAVVSPKLVGFLRELMVKLRSSPKIWALKTGMREVERLVPIWFDAGVFDWAPQLLRWFREEPYLEWLGFTKLSMVTAS